jgi:hypothetical protein
LTRNLFERKHMRKIIVIAALASLTIMNLMGCGPKLTDAERNTPPPPSASNPTHYVPPPTNANGGGPPPSASANH